MASKWTPTRIILLVIAVGYLIYMMTTEKLVNPFVGLGIAILAGLVTVIVGIARRKNKK